MPAFHEIGQIFTVDRPRGPAVYEAMVAVRAERQRLVTEFLATATAEMLAEEREAPWASVTGVPSSVTAFA